jgi:hypothetical protein
VSRVAARFDVDNGWWTDRDISIGIAPALSLDIRSLIEEHGGGKCLFRAGFRLRGAWLATALLAAAGTAAAAGWVRTDVPSVRMAIEALAMMMAIGVGAIAVRVAESAVAVSMALRGIAIEYRMFDTRRVARRPAPGAPPPGPADPGARQAPAILSPVMAVKRADSPPRIAQERR